MDISASCALCVGSGGDIVWNDATVRVVMADEPEIPGFVRVIAQEHQAEMTDFAAATRSHIIEVVFAAEETVKSVMNAHKMNLASLGNQVAHVHWHVVPRWNDDPWFPQPIWANRTRTPSYAMPGRRAKASELRSALGQVLVERFGGGAR